VILDNEVLVHTSVPAATSILAFEESGIQIQCSEGEISICNPSGEAISGRAEISLLDMKGKVIRQANLNESKIGTSGMAPGLYLLRLKSEGKIIHRKIKL
jgi:hypothetical protein